MEIDSTLFANQIGTYGIETMKKIANLSVFIYGMRGLGAEISKNIILSGAKIVTIYDNSKVISSDLNSNYFLSASDIGKTTRAEASLRKLQSLNSNAQINVFQGELAHDFKVLDSYSIVIISEIINLEMAETLDEYCREKKIGFIYSACLGLSGFAFTDFGDEFIILDHNGEEPKQYFVRNITNACPGVVTIDNSIDHKPLDLSSGDFVTFKEVSGMSELNDTPPRPIRVLSPTTFTIEDTSKFQEYNCSGTIEEIKVPRPISFRPLREAKNHIYREEVVVYGDEHEELNQDKDEQIDIKGNYNNTISNNYNEGNNRTSIHSMSNDSSMQKYSYEQIDMTKKMQNEKLHVAYLAIHEFFIRMNYLPHMNSKTDCDLCVKIGKEIYDSALKHHYPWANTLTIFDAEFTYNIARWSRAQIPPICSFLGGIIAQEIVKITGKYTPLNQWLWFDFMESVSPILAQEALETNTALLPKRISHETRYNEQVAILNEKVNSTLINFNILLIGCGALGNELLKIFSLMGISSGQLGKITIADDDIIEKTNLNPNFIYNINDVGHSKGEKCKEILMKHNLNLHIDFLQMKINEANDKMLPDSFWEKQDIVICAVDNYQSRQYADMKCKWFKKVLINLGTLCTKAHCQTIIPGHTSCYSDDYIPDEAHEIVIEFPTTIDHCIDWARETFMKSFSNEIKEINLLLQSTPSNIKAIFDSFNNQKEYNADTITKVERYKQLLNIKASKSFPVLVGYSIDKFQELFDESIQSLLSAFPSDATNEDGSKFWSGAKRQPQNIRFDIKDSRHFLFISTFSILIAHCLRIQLTDQFTIFKETAAKYPIRDYLYNKKNKMKEEFKVNDFFDYIAHHQQQPHSKEQLKELVFNKQNDDNQHVNFIMAAANVRAQNYKLNECDFLKAKICSGKCLPTVGTATASISGIAAMQVLSLATCPKLNDISAVDHLRNCFMNIGINYILMTELFPKKVHMNKMNGSMIETKAIPSNWKTWDEIEIDKSMTLNEFIEYFLNTYQIKIAKVFNGRKVLSSFTEEQMNKKIEMLFEMETESNGSDEGKRRDAQLEVNGVTVNNEKIAIPLIHYSFMKTN